MKSKRLFLAIGNIDDQFINEDAEVIAAPKDRRSERPTFAPWLKLAVPVAACLAIAVGVFVGQSGLFTPHNVSDVVGDVKQIASSEQTRLAPAESSIAPQQHTEAPSIPSTETADVYVGQNGLSAPPDAGGDVKQIASTEQTDLVSTETPFVPQQQTEAPSIPSTETAHLSVININELSEISAARLIIDLKPEDFVPMDKNEIVDYYGIDFFPSTIPADMKIVEEGTYGIYKRDEGAGEVYYSANLAWYVDENVHRQLQVNIDKGKLPHSCFAYLGTEYEKSMINGTELLIGRSVGH
ncbi:MAG: hypothetical protein FWH01_05530, partial [Oscillospiraceae bacterium]|nr:hypothetical protein [Oscillospiraceae bacterium]